MKLPKIVELVSRKGGCVRCGGCCKRPPPVSKPEAENIALRLGLTLDEFKQKYLEYSGSDKLCMIRRTGHLEENVCIFLVADRGKLIKGRTHQCSCMIHDFKPLVCEVQYCGLSKKERKRFYTEMKKFILDNVGYRWPV